MLFLGYFQNKQLHVSISINLLTIEVTVALSNFWYLRYVIDFLCVELVYIY